MSRYLITTPIYYINDKPHVGHAYTTVIADTMARWYRQLGHEVFFLTGTDENSQKTVQAADKKGMNLREYTSEMAGIWENTWRDLGISFNHFIRTTDAEHVAGVEAFWRAVSEREVGGEPAIYKGIYTGLYCEGCEAYLKEGDLVDGKCPHHNTKPIRLDEENYFFRLQGYRQPLLDRLDAKSDFVVPAKRFNEVRNYIDQHLDPLSISRSTRDWGIPVPDDNGQVIYVWFDALLNYLTGVGYGSNESRYYHWWEEEDSHVIHLVGKDIIKFHCAIWPAMLMAGGVPLPDQVAAHGFFTIDGTKISKSLGNAIDPLELKVKYGFDAVRYFLLREIPFGEDGDFSFERLAKRYKDDLANDLGNLLNRVLVMTEKYTEGKVPPVVKSSDHVEQATQLHQQLEELIPAYRFDLALEQIWQLLGSLNQAIDQEKPWVLAKENNPRLPGLIYDWLESLRHVAVALSPFMPESAARLLAQLGYQAQGDKPDPAGMIRTWGGLAAGQRISRGEPLFPQLG